MAKNEGSGDSTIGGLHLDVAMKRLAFEREDVIASAIPTGFGYPIQLLEQLGMAQLHQSMLFVAYYPMLPRPAQLAICFIPSRIVEFSWQALARSCWYRELLRLFFGR
ncbi:hypothetical protein D3C78_1360180 [compost metagenome]